MRRSSWQTVWAPFARMGLAAGVVACLCFSAGEGLRLTPLPVSALAGASSPGERLKPADASEAKRHNCGPLDQPAQAQKRGKRQTPERSPSASTICPRGCSHGAGVRCGVGLTRWKGEGARSLPGAP